MWERAKKFLTQIEKDGWEYLYDQDRVNKEIPEISAIYCFVRYDVLSGISEAVYVGKSTNISVRLKPWHVIERKFDRKFGDLFCYIKPCKDIDEKEKFYIRKFAPSFNIQHNPNITRKVVYQYGKPIL